MKTIYSSIFTALFTLFGFYSNAQVVEQFLGFVLEGAAGRGRLLYLQRPVLQCLARRGLNIRQNDHAHLVAILWIRRVTKRLWFFWNERGL